MFRLYLNQGCSIMTKIIITIILVNIVITIISGPYDFIWKIYFKIVMYINDIFSANKVAMMTSTF